MSDAEEKLTAIRERHAAACVYGRPTRHEEPVEAHNDRGYLLSLLDGRHPDASSQEYYLDQIADILDNERWSRLEHCNAIYDLFARFFSGPTPAVTREQIFEITGNRVETDEIMALIASGLLGTKGEG